MSPVAPPVSTASQWREVPPAVPARVTTLRAVRRAVVVPEVSATVWADSVAAADRAFRRPGVGGPAGRRWASGPGRGGDRVRLTAVAVARGIRAEVEHAAADIGWLPAGPVASEWLGADEVEGLRDACPARVAPADVRRPRRPSPAAPGRPVAAHSAPLPEGVAEWRPSAAEV